MDSLDCIDQRENSEIIGELSANAKRDAMGAFNGRLGELTYFLNFYLDILNHPYDSFYGFSYIERDLLPQKERTRRQGVFLSHPNVSSIEDQIKNYCDTVRQNIHEEALRCRNTLRPDVSFGQTIDEVLEDLNLLISQYIDALRAIDVQNRKEITPLTEPDFPHAYLSTIKASVSEAFYKKISPHLHQQGNVDTLSITDIGGQEVDVHAPFVFRLNVGFVRTDVLEAITKALEENIPDREERESVQMDPRYFYAVNELKLRWEEYFKSRMSALQAGKVNAKLEAVDNETPNLMDAALNVYAVAIGIQNDRQSFNTLSLVARRVKDLVRRVTRGRNL